MKYLKEYNEIIDRISDDKIQLFSDKIGIRESDKISFYISDIQYTQSDMDIDGFCTISISFYNPDVTVFGSKIIKVYFSIYIEENAERLMQFYGQVGNAKMKHNPVTIIDVEFTKKSFKELKEFLKEDSPICYNLIKNISLIDIQDINRKLKRRI